MADGYIPYHGPIVTADKSKSAGSQFYFTGKPCKYGHISQRWVANRTCVECSRRHCSEWGEAHADVRKERRFTAYWANPERYREAAKEYAKRNPEIIRAREKRFRAENPQLIAARRKAWRDKNKEHIKEYDSDPDLVRAKNHARRARKLAAEGEHKKKDIAEIRRMQKDKCAVCGLKLKGRGHIDHIVPLSKGGSNYARNLQLLCEPCNLSKSARDPIDFMRSRGRLL